MFRVIAIVAGLGLALAGSVEAQTPRKGGTIRMTAPYGSSFTSLDIHTTQRAQDYCQAQKTIWNAAPWIFLYNQKNPILTTTKVTGVYGLPNEQFVTSWAAPA